jgi:hypothetical protein
MASSRPHALGAVTMRGELAPRARDRHEAVRAGATDIGPHSVGPNQARRWPFRPEGFDLAKKKRFSP